MTPITILLWAVPSSSTSQKVKPFINTIGIPAGTEKVIKVDYATNSGTTALNWLKKEQTDGGKEPYLFSQCEAIHCRSFAPL